MTNDIVSILKNRVISLEHSFEQKIAELSLLKELGDALKGASLTHWNDTILRQLDIIKKHTGIFSVSIMILDEKSNEIYVVSASELAGSIVGPSINLKKGEGVAGKVIENGTTVYIPDVTREPSFMDKGTGQKGSLACIPIISKGACIGALNFREDLKNAFGPNDLRFFELIADQLSITVSLIRSYHDVLTLEKKKVNLSRYFSRGLAEHLIADDRMTELGGELMMVTVLFADIAGFTSMLEIRPFEQVVEVLNRFFKTVVPKIFQNGGMLDKFLGDGIMAVFGIPYPDAMDPVKAIKCAVDIQTAVSSLKTALKEEGLFPIDVGIGIASGIVLAGNIGSEEHMNYTVIGEPVNLAERLESICAPKEIIVSKSTADLALAQSSLDVQFKPMGKVSIKGIPKESTPLKVIYTI